MEKLRFFFICILSFTTVSAFAQQSMLVKGKVTDENNQGLPGVTIVEKDAGAQRGTITDVDGNYSFQTGGEATLVFSFIGFTTQEVPVNGRNVVNVKMKSGVVGLEEVVAIGYGVQRKADLTGAIGSVSANEIARQPSLNAAYAIQGKVSGVNIINNDSPDATPTVIVRGLGTALGGRNPLYIVDGFPVTDIKSISPSDIVSMDILKDASSASIYGLRAANGVILVTTKKGQKGKAKINVESYYGIKNIQNNVEMANAEEYITYFNEVQASKNATWQLAGASQQAYNTDWFDELTDVGHFSNTSVSISGGSENVDYLLSYNYYDEDGILDEATFQRSTIRNNNVYKLFDDRLRFSQNLNISFTKAKPKPYGSFTEAYRQSPLVPVRYENGRWGRPIVNTSTGIVTYQGEAGETIGNLNSIGNPVFTVDNTNELKKTFTIQGGLEAELKITDYLKFNSRVGVTKYYSTERKFGDIKRAWLQVSPTRTEEEFENLKSANPSVTTYANNSLEIADEETFRWAWENFLTFTRSFNMHNVTATIGASREKTGIGKKIGAKGYDVPTKSQYWNVSLASLDYEKEVTHTYLTPIAFASYFGRVQYDFDNKYYFNATIRRDGTSIFRDSGDYWGTFPAFGLGWTISRENFMSNAEWLNFLKLRGTWGRLGNQEVPLNVSQTLTSPGSSNYNYVFGPDQVLVFGAAFGTPARGVTWEVTEEWGIGFDFGLFESRLTGSMDYYNKKNTNAILRIRPTLNSAYSDDFFDHGAEVVNKGFEMTLGWSNQISNDLSYQVGVNYSYNRNEVVNVKPAYDGHTGGSLANGEITKQLREGQPLYAWWMYEADGVWQIQSEIDNNPAYGSPSPGYLRYKNQNEDDVIDSRDKIFFGSYVPTSYYGVNLGIDYKDFDFSMDGYGVAGNKVYNALKGVRIDGGENIARETYQERWTGEGSTNVHPGANRDSYASNYYLENGAFFRINNISLGYTLNNLVLDQSKLRIYFTAQNPFVFTKYSGFSPEINSDGDPVGTTGIELSAYPTTRNFIFGVSIQF